MKKRDREWEGDFITRWQSKKASLPRGVPGVRTWTPLLMEHLVPISGRGQEFGLPTAVQTSSAPGGSSKSPRWALPLTDEHYLSGEVQPLWGPR